MRGLKLVDTTRHRSSCVAPHTGAWIETSVKAAFMASIQSHPTRVRGLKRQKPVYTRHHHGVAPHTGAWIETLVKFAIVISFCVAPHTGAWIETTQRKIGVSDKVSHPTRVRGLKPSSPAIDNENLGRTPHGCVD